MSNKDMQVVVFPKDPNPYQDLLYGHFPKETVITYFTPIKRNIFELFMVLPFTVIRLARLRLKGNKIIHIHWIYPFYLPKKLPFNKLLSYLNVAIFLKCVHLMRFKVVWTVHNVVPQSQMTINDASLMRKLAKLANVKIVHSNSVIDEMKSLNISTENATVIPIGSYGGIYPDTINREEARKKLHIGNTEFVVLFFGIINPYKGTEELIKAFSRLKLPNSRLVIAGQCSSPNLKKELLKAVTKHRNINVYEGFIDDKDIETYFKACDIVCLPFRKITTSSSVMLAMAFAKPIVVPQLGALRDLPQDAGYFYNTTDNKALENTLLQAATHKSELHHLGEAAKAYSDSLSWDKIAAQTNAVYADLVN